VGAWIDTLRQQAGGTNNAELEASDAGMLLTDTELLFANMQGVQRAQLTDIAKVGREAGELLISSSQGTLIRGPISAKKEELTSFFASVRQVAARARQVSVPVSAEMPTMTASNLSSVTPQEVSSRDAYAAPAPPAIPATVMMPPPVIIEAVPASPSAPMMSAPPAPIAQQQANAAERERFRAGFGQVKEELKLSAPAGFWLRVVAFIIDSIVMNIAQWILFAVFAGGSLGLSGLLSSRGSSGFDPAALATLGTGYLIATIASGLFGWLYYALLESGERQGTLGKMALGLIVTDSDRKRIGFGRATARAFMRSVIPLVASGIYLAVIATNFSTLTNFSADQDAAQAYAGTILVSTLIFLIAICVPFVLAGFTKKKQTLHDMVTNTLVLRK
jgi:uncharacterized RDD family membrane protein YckC